MVHSAKNLSVSIARSSSRLPCHRIFPSKRNLLQPCIELAKSLTKAGDLSFNLLQSRLPQLLLYHIHKNGRSYAGSVSLGVSICHSLGTTHRLIRDLSRALSDFGGGRYWASSSHHGSADSNCALSIRDGCKPPHSQAAFSTSS